MKWFIGFIASFFSGIISFLVKKFGYSAVLFTLQKSVQVIVIALLLAFFVFFTNYVLQIWNAITTLVNDFQSVSAGSGSAYGITLATILENTKGFIYASGLSDAIVTAGNLFISVLSLIFIRGLYFVYIKVIMYIYKMFDDGIKLLAGSTVL